MRKKKPEKTQAQLDRESKEFFEKNRRELEAALVRYCTDYGLDFEPPFSFEEGKEILKVAKQEEFGKLLKMFPNYNELGEWEKLAAKCIFKFGLDPKKFSLKRGDWPRINEAIGEKLNSSRSVEVNSDLCKFRKG